MADPIATALAAGQIAPHEVGLARRLLAVEVEEEGIHPADSWIGAQLLSLPYGRAATIRASAAEYDDEQLERDIEHLRPPRSREEAWARQDEAMRQQRIAASAYQDDDGSSAYEELYGELDREIDRLSPPGARHDRG